MSSSAPRGGERMIQQDFIARIRYSNALPPPPNPPKLLNIPNTGLASGQYTSPSFASRLAREQPLNIEADAELGMPLDLVGMPGVFDGDESSIQAPAVQPHVHPHDRPLLRPLSTLGRPKGTDTSVSFLRRTEYISSYASKRGPAANAGAFLKPKIKRPEKRPAPEPEAGSPAAIRRKIDKSFDAAQRYLKDPRSIQHPSKKPGVHVVDSRPFIPDLDAFPDAGAYVTVKFQTNPVPSSSTYDRRLLSAILRPITKTPEEEEAFQAAVEAHARNPEMYPKPSNLLDFQYFLPADKPAGERFRAAFDVDNPDRHSTELYTHNSESKGPCFQFHRIRSYETTKEVEIAASEKYADEVLVSFNEAEEAAAGGSAATGDGNPVPRQKAAYFYPVMQRSTIRPQREKNILRNALSQGGADDEEEQVVNQLDVTLQDPDEELRDLAVKYKANPLAGHADVAEEPEDEADANAQLQAEATGAERNGDSEGRERDDGRDRRAAQSPGSERSLDGDADADEEP